MLLGKIKQHYCCLPSLLFLMELWVLTSIFSGTSFSCLNLSNGVRGVDGTETFSNYHQGQKTTHDNVHVLTYKSFIKGVYLGTELWKVSLSLSFLQQLASFTIIISPCGVWVCYETPLFHTALLIFPYGAGCTESSFFPANFFTFHFSIATLDGLTINLSHSHPQPSTILSISFVSFGAALSLPLTLALILLICLFWFSISEPMSMAMLRRLPIMVLTWPMFSSISSSRASLVILRVEV